MAYVPDQKQQQIPEEEQNKFASPNQTTPNPIPPQTGGSSGAGGFGQTRGTAPGVGSSTQFGSNAAKLSDYLKVNAPQIEQWGQKIAGNLNQGFGQVQNDINQGVGAFNQSVQQGIPQLSADQTNQATQNPSEFVKNPGNVSQFQSAYQGNYTGPQNFESGDTYSNLNNQVNSAVQNAELAGSPSSIGTYLNNTEGANETSGMRTLDTALLQGNPNAQAAINAAVSPYKNLSSYLGTQAQGADTGVQNAKANAAQNAAALQKQFTGQGGVVPTFQNDLTARLQNASTAASTAANKAKTDLLAGRVTPADLQVLGIDQGQLGWLSGTMQNLQSDYGNNFDLTNYLTMQNPNTVFANPNAIATTDDYARAAALAQLTGADMSGYLDQSQAGNAGKQNNSLMNFNVQGAGNDATTALKQNDLGVLTNFLATHGKTSGSQSIDDLVNNYLGKNTSLILTDPAQNQQFQDALFRYATQWAPVATPPPPVTPPTVVTPGTATLPPYAGIYMGGGGGSGIV